MEWTQVFQGSELMITSEVIDVPLLCALLSVFYDN